MPSGALSCWDRTTPSLISRAEGDDILLLSPYGPGVCLNQAPRPLLLTTFTTPNYQLYFQTEWGFRIGLFLLSSCLFLVEDPKARDVARCLWRISFCNWSNGFPFLRLLLSALRFRFLRVVISCRLRIVGSEVFCRVPQTAQANLQAVSTKLHLLVLNRFSSTLVGDGSLFAKPPYPPFISFVITHYDWRRRHQDCQPVQLIRGCNHEKSRKPRAPFS